MADLREHRSCKEFGYLRIKKKIDSEMAEILGKVLEVANLCKIPIYLP